MTTTARSDSTKRSSPRPSIARSTATTRWRYFPTRAARHFGLHRSARGGCGPNGPFLFLNVDGRLDEVLGRVYAAGGRIVVPRTDIGDGMGWFAMILDSEGNRIGLHTIS